MNEALFSKTGSLFIVGILFLLGYSVAFSWPHRSRVRLGASA